MPETEEQATVGKWVWKLRWRRSSGLEPCPALKIGAEWKMDVFVHPEMLKVLPHKYSIGERRNRHGTSCSGKGRS